MIETDTEKKARIAFHEKLLAMGVKGYRKNDKLVNIPCGIIEFMWYDFTPGKAWRDTSVYCLNSGDKIFIGDLKEGGQFAIITHVYSRLCYSFRLLDEFYPEKISIFQRIKNSLGRLCKTQKKRL